MRVIFLGGFVASCVSADLVGLTTEQTRAIEADLMKSCGDDCLKEWHQMVREHDGKSVLEAMTDVTQKAVSHAKNLQTVMSSPETFSSYLAQGHTSKALSTWNPLDTPCFDQASCALVEVLANKSNFGRIATMAIYQALNMPTHIVAVVSRVLCACLGIYRTHVCFLGPVFPVCEPLFNLSKQLFSMTTQAWEATKTTTKFSKVIGQPLIAS